MPATSATFLYRGLPPADEAQRCRHASFSVRHLDSVRVLVAATGTIDASNRHELGRFVERHTRIAGQLILDLTGIEAFGRHGFTALYYVSVHCARRGVDWMLFGSRTMRQELGTCDPSTELPLVDDLASALTRLDNLAHGAGTMFAHPVSLSVTTHG